MAKRKNELMGNIKDTMAVGIGSMAGLGAMGAMANLPGMPAEAGTVSRVAGSGLVLANVGQLGKTGMGIASSFKQTTKYRKTKVKKTTHSNKVLKNILG